MAAAAHKECLANGLNGDYGHRRGQTTPLLTLKKERKKQVPQSALVK